MSLLWAEYSKYINEYKLNDGLEKFKQSDFSKQIKKAGYVKDAQKKIKIGGKLVSFWELNADKLLSIGCNEFVKEELIPKPAEDEELTPEPVKDNEIKMFYLKKVSE